MDVDKLRQLLRQREPEDLKLEFKRELYCIYHPERKVQKMHWDEFIKDILALANGNVGTAQQTGYLIIGVSDKLNQHGTRDLYDVGDVKLTATQILQKVNSACKPRLPTIYCDTILFEGKRILIITIPPTPYLHETVRSLKTPDRIYPENTVFIRRKEGIGLADTFERQAILAEKKGTPLHVVAPIVAVLGIVVIVAAIWAGVYFRYKLLPQQAAEAQEHKVVTQVESQVVASSAESTSTYTPRSPTNTPRSPTSTSRLPTKPKSSPTNTPTVALIPTPTPTPKPMAVVQAETLNVRSGPGTEYDVLGQVKQGGELEIVARTEEDDWLQVRLADGKEGWVSVQGVDLNCEMMDIPVAAFIPSTPTLVLPTETPTLPPPPDVVYVPAGGFIMGSSDAEVDYALQLCNEYYSGCEWERFRDEQPQHTVYLDAFWIDKYEVTNTQYRRCVKAGVCQVPMTCDRGEPTYEDTSKAEHPVVCVSWYRAKAYCEWTGARLPTEAEWEKAARGTDGWIYPWGNTPDGSKLNSCDVNCPEHEWKDALANDGYAYTAPVGSYPAGASPYGAVDMAGNVWEWTQSLWGENREKPDFKYPYNPEDGRENTEASNDVLRVLRGGSWYIAGVRTADRHGCRPRDRNPDVGFRCARSSE